MKLAFGGQAHYTDFNDWYSIYCKRNAQFNPVDLKTYKRVIKAYCRLLAERLEKEGQIELPSNVGTITAAFVTKKPQYRNDKFVGYGAWNWKERRYDGKLKAFAMVFLPSKGRNENLRCFGFVANRRLFKRMKVLYNERRVRWVPLEFKNEMI